MYIKIGEAQYPCGKPAFSSTTLRWPNVEGLATPVSGLIETCRNDGFVMREDNTQDWLRQTYQNNVFTLTNLPEPEPAPEPDLDSVKAARIAQTKQELETYLLEHPLQWTDGNYYAITAEKQNQLTSKILSATIATQTSTPYNLTWNDTGEVCQPWELADLMQLAFAIDARVTALVTYQQEKEVEIRDCETYEEVMAVVVDYDSVGAATEGNDETDGAVGTETEAETENTEDGEAVADAGSAEESGDA